MTILQSHHIVQTWRNPRPMLSIAMRRWSSRMLALDFAPLPNDSSSAASKETRRSSAIANMSIAVAATLTEMARHAASGIAAAAPLKLDCNPPTEKRCLRVEVDPLRAVAALAPMRSETALRPKYIRFVEASALGPCLSPWLVLQLGTQLNKC